MTMLPDDPKYEAAEREIRWLLVEPIARMKAEYPMLAGRAEIEPTLASRLTRVWEGLVKYDPACVAEINAQLAPFGYTAVGLEHTYASDTMCYIGVSVVPTPGHPPNDPLPPQ